MDSWLWSFTSWQHLRLDLFLRWVPTCDSAHSWRVYNAVPLTPCPDIPLSHAILILHQGADSLISQWGSAIKSSWVCTVISRYPSWHDLRCCKDVKLQQPTRLAHLRYRLTFDVVLKSDIQIWHTFETRGYWPYPSNNPLQQNSPINTQALLRRF